MELEAISYEVGGKPTKWLTNVTKPTLTIYRPMKDKDTGATMLICPGGGYHNLGWDVEGEEVAAWLNSLGGQVHPHDLPLPPGVAQPLAKRGYRAVPGVGSGGPA